MAAGLGIAAYTHSAPSLPRRSTPPTPAQRPDALPATTPGSPGMVSHTPELPLSMRPLTSPVIKAPCAILIDAVSGQVLFQQNADEKRPMASTTKIMTALLFCESVPDSAVVTASKYASTVRDSSLHLKEGEKISAHDLLRAILMRSANDGCVAAAEHTCGTEAAFVAKMNARAAQLGATQTHFTNPHGLHNTQHYTTARDLALIARAAMQEERICEVVRTQTCRITRSLDKRDVTMNNHSHFLGHFPGADGVKTGWTIPAGHCYVGSATWGNWRLISVVLKSPDYVHETADLMKFGFENFEAHTIAQPGDSAGVCEVASGLYTSVEMRVQKPMRFVTRKGVTPQIEKRIRLQPVSAPLASGTQVGTLEAWVDGAMVASSPLVAAESVAFATPAIRIQSNGAWGKMAMALGILASGLVSLRYGTRYGTRFAAFAKGSRRRRSRLSARLRDLDNRG